jgi:colicin import membrane protein
MWKKKEKKQEEKEEKKQEEKEEESLLEELCGDDAELFNLLSRYLYFNPVAAISEKGLDILTEEAEKSGDFRPAVDKAIFEGAQNPGERERYIKVIRNLALKAIHAIEQEEEKVEKEGLTDQAASLGRRTENYRVMSERTEDIINVASKFYNERLVELGEEARREARREERQRTQIEEGRTLYLEKAEREARKKERGKMGREEKREAEIQDKREELAADERKKAGEEERKDAEMEERRIGELEKAEREARKKERGGN